MVVVVVGVISGEGGEGGEDAGGVKMKMKGAEGREPERERKGTIYE